MVPAKENGALFFQKNISRTANWEVEKGWSNVMESTHPSKTAPNRHASTKSQGLNVSEHPVLGRRISKALKSVTSRDWCGDDTHRGRLRDYSSGKYLPNGESNPDLKGENLVS